MTREQIIEGLTQLIVRLAIPADIPPSYHPEEWAYIKGLASAEILRLRDRLVAIDSGPVNRDPGAAILLKWGE
jgi:hypothetical protein